MAKKSASFIDLHAEKIVVGVCALVMIGAVVYGLGGGRFAMNDKSTGELCQSVEEAADLTRQAIASAQPKPKESTTPQPGGGDDPVVRLAEWFGGEAKGLIKIADVSTQLARTQPYPMPYVPIVASGGSTRRQLAQCIAPDVPIVSSGRSSFNFPAEKPELQGFDGRVQGTGKPVEKNWVSVAAQVDLTSQDANFRAESYPEGSFLEVVQVHLQRKDQTDPRRGWEDVETYVSYKPPTRPPMMVNGAPNMEGMVTFRSLINTAAEYIARPRLPSDAATLPAVPFLDESPRSTAQTPDEAEQEASRRVKKWMDLAKEALAGRRKFKTPDLDAAYLLARAAAGTVGARAKDTEDARKLLAEIKAKMPKGRRPDLQDQVRSPDRLMPIVAHDLNVEPGHKYVYRIRYEVYNVYAGNPGELANPDDARRLTIFSGWSPASGPVEVTSDTYFYLTKADRAKKEVTVSVFKVTRRETRRKDYRVQVGDAIGRKETTGSKLNFSTGLECVDIDFDRVVDGQKDVSMIYVDPRDNSLGERLLSRDKKDKSFQRLTEAKTAAR
ncbi:MAG TPA: hypothetical protein VJZ71_08110 [Phycisphaerae bacterium]|nr:hypothetical protein [Phycisphaerae bacterium]